MAKTEILAPVGGKEQLLAAVRSGADAVYFGAASFNARRNADNFSDEEFISAVSYCRERGVKAYITLNTLIKDSEMNEFSETLALIAKSGADAVIVQDMGVFERVRSCCPDIPVHASTQMAVHNVSGAKLLESLGFSRIVLARELSIKEIREITSSVKTEIEVFVHGAHCMSASGMCYMSSVFGARSGNRGLCAQPCRLNFRYKNREYALSLKDMCLVDGINELIEAGVTSLKIEGRMKRPEYVAAAVTAYKRAVKGEKPDITALQNIFSRSGFTNGYAAGKRDLSMFGYRTKEDVLSAKESLAEVENTYKNENPLVGVSMKFTVRDNEPSVLEITDGKNTVTVTGAVPERAIKAPLSIESAERSLKKLGSTFFYPEKTECDISDGLMLRASDINALRREATDKLTALRGNKAPYSYSPYERPLFSVSGWGEPKLYLSFMSFDSIPDDADADMFILPLTEILRIPDKAKAFPERLIARLPALIYPESEKRLLAELKKLPDLGINKVLCDNIGALALTKQAGLEPVGGALLNIINSDSAEKYYSLGVKALTVSPEASFRSIKTLKTRADTGLVVYGYLPLMHFRCCPLQGEAGCGKCEGKGEITDRRNEKFTVLCENRKYSVLYNSVPLYVGDKALPDVSFVIMSFTTEPKGEIRKIISAYKNKKAPAGRKTAGLYERELL
ncbi:MAG: U32 family peptidase [Clostridia bacterium]|nr:U32 family peptidase [Clostridia bacterium]